MEEDLSTSSGALRDRSLPSFNEGGGKLWGWVFFSCFVHAALIWTLFVIPHVPARRSPSYPVYTVELVGGEKIGGTTVSSVTVPTPPTKEEPKKLKAEPPPQVEAVKKERKKTIESPTETREKMTLKDSKKEVKKELPAEKGLPDQLREKLIQSALERVKERTETEQKKKKPSGVSSGPGEGEGAAALGEGGRGGGTVRGIEFINYLNRMRNVIRERWTWAGKRSDLEVKVRFGIQENGEIVGLRIVQRSGDLSYDDSVLRALKRASPLPPPPENYRKDFMDVELIFQPKDLGG